LFASVQGEKRKKAGGGIVSSREGENEVPLEEKKYCCPGRKGDFIVRTATKGRGGPRRRPKKRGSQRLHHGASKRKRGEEGGPSVSTEKRERALGGKKRTTGRAALQSVKK